MKLQYYMPFHASADQDLASALQNKLLHIEGEAIDSSVNANRWQVPEEDLDYLLLTLRGTQLRANHAEDIYMVIGMVPDATRVGPRVLFKAEVADERLFDKILRHYITHVSIQVDSDDVECSKCRKPTRREGMMVHLCPGAWEIVHKPRVRELSIVASPAYKNTVFKPAGFASAMNLNQQDAASSACLNCGKKAEAGRVCSCGFSQLSEDNEDVGSKGNLQEPENKNLNAHKEVKPTSEQNAQAKASPLQAQGVVNTAQENQHLHK